MAALLYGLAVRLVGDLSSPLVKDYVGKPWKLGSKSEFEKIKSSVSAIEAVLLDAEEKQKTDRQVQDWLIKIKLVFYDLEDLLQEVCTKALKRQVKCRIKNKWAKKVHIFSKKVHIFSLPNQVMFRFKVGRKVKLIRERLGAIASDRSAFNFTVRNEEILWRRDESHSFVPVDQFIGRHADKECVTQHLLHLLTPNEVSVISIVGIGGIGKTTLAQSIYDSKEVKSNFQLRMWVCVSVPFDVKTICENIIESATKTKCERLQMDGVKGELKKAIDGRKYLLVLDDVWNESHYEWSKLAVLLSGGAEGSKILITARAVLAAQAASSIATRVLEGLSREDSLALFKQIAFKRGVEQVNPTMERIGKAVVEKCVGVPLVVKVIGSMLAVKEEEADWLDFEKNDLPQVAQDSEGIVLPILKLSYDYLTASLKRCFVYCAIYPKDHEIEKRELIGMWVAHGLIQLDGTSRSLDDVGERHFMNLLDRSFFEEHARDTFNRGIIKIYKMHDLIHDLAQSLGGDEYYNFGTGANCMVKSTRHTWVSGDKLTNIGHDWEKLHTLIVTEPYDKQKVNELACSTFEQLRVLRLKHLELERVPQFVGGLRHLYYLDLSNNKFSSLPESICSLYNLQTLILSDCNRLEELPAGTRDLMSLRRIDVSGSFRLRHMPRGLEELTSLETLSDFVCMEEGGGKTRRKSAEVCELKSLVNLRGRLEIKKLRASKCGRKRSCILIELTLIMQLLLSWNWNNEELKEEEEEEEWHLIESLNPHTNLEELVIERYPGKKFPSWIDSLANIRSIVLVGCDGWRHVSPLGLLPCLQQLRLKSMSELKRLVEPTEQSNRYFPVLEKLEIRGCPLFLADGREGDVKQFVSLLKELRFSDVWTETLPSWLQYLPHLQTLKLNNCNRIVSLPEWMGNLTSLQELHLVYLPLLASIPDCFQRLTSLQRLVIHDCSKNLVSRCEKETGVDWHKIKHIPNIDVTDLYIQVSSPYWHPL